MAHHLKFSQVLLTEIFLRSLVESLLRAKCVCKHWYYLIKNPTFALDHFEFQKIHNKGRLLVHYRKGRSGPFSYVLFDDEAALRRDAYHDLDDLRFITGNMHMDGPINGLYCLYDLETRIVFWNPALKEFGTFPLPPSPFFHHMGLADRSSGVIGFGMDPLTHVYKLVLIRNFIESRRIDPEEENQFQDYDHVVPDTFVTVYDLSTNTWRVIDVGEFRRSDYNIGSTNNSSFLDGFYYWWARRWRTGSLIAFDMGKETFREISGPDTCSFDESSYLFPSVTLYNAKVALFFRMTDGVDVWVMLEDGEWIKQFSFTFFPHYLVAVGVWKNDVFLFHSSLFSQPSDFENHHIILYSATTHEMRKVGPRGPFTGFGASIFYESLVSVTAFELENKGKHKSLKTIQDFFAEMY